jgi:D-glycero-beta-D-manno-heptose-7-phosphate kinase
MKWPGNLSASLFIASNFCLKGYSSGNNPLFWGMADFQQLFNAISSLRVGVIGDVMLDTYMWGKVERISPEAPVPVVTVEKTDYRIGGAGNVALNAKSLGAAVSILSVTGNDEDAKLLSSLLNGQQIDTSYLIQSTDRITTNKIRVISRNQQMMRLDTEIVNDLTKAEEKQLVDKTAAFIAAAKPHVIIFEDYNKGVLTESVITEVIKLCKQAGVLTAVDPKRKNFFTYKQCDIFKPNLKEVKEALNLLLEEISLPVLNKIHGELHGFLGHRNSLITLSEKGVFYQEGDKGTIVPSHFRNIADVSGAGDTVIAVASLVYAATKDMALAASMANIAGGLVCEEVGTVAISREKLLHECIQLLS